MVRSFGDFELDEELYQLRRGGVPVPLAPKAFDLLAYLIRHADRVVTKDELFSRIWPRETVGEAALTTCVHTLRRALGDVDEPKRLIATVRRRGYRFVPEATARPVGADDFRRDATAPGGAGSTSAGPDRSGAGRPRRRHRAVGRERELSLLGSLTRAATEGQGQLVLLFGEAGVGKTRLAEELGDRFRAAGGRSVVGGGREGDWAPAFWPWIEVVRDLTRAADDDAVRRWLGSEGPEVLHLVRSLRARFPDIELPSVQEGEQAQFRLFEGVRAVLTRVAADAPLLVVLEDLHCADRSSLQLLQFMAHETAAAGIVLLVTYRDADLDPDHPLLPVLSALRREGHCTRLPLQGLSPEAVRALVACLGGPEIPGAVVDAIVRITEGNPLFVVEMVHHLADHVGTDAHRWFGALDEGTLGVPDEVRDVIGRRLGQLDDSCLAVLRIAAALGRDFAADPLACVLPPHLRGLLGEALDRCVATRVIAARAQVGFYTFSHALFREVLYQQMGPARRATLHAEIATMLERRDGDLAEIAYHLERAAGVGLRAKAVDYATRAGDRAAAMLAYDAAATHYEQALRVLGRQRPDDRGHRRRLLLSLGNAQVQGGRATLARATFGAAAEVAEADGDTDALAEAALGFGGRHLRRFGIADPDTVSLLEAAVARGDVHHPLRSQLLARLALALRHAAGTLERRRALVAEACMLARRQADRATLAGVLDDSLWALWLPDNLDERLALTAEVLALAGGGAAPEMEVRAYGWRFVGLLESGDVPGAEAARHKHAALADSLRLPIYRLDAAQYRYATLLMHGESDEAERCALETFAAKTDDLPDDARQTLGVQIGCVRYHQGRAHEIIDVMHDMLDRHPSSWRTGLAYVLTDCDRHDEAAEILRGFARDRFLGIPRDSVWLSSLVQLAVTSHAVGAADAAGALYDLLLPFAGRLVVVSEFGLVCFGAVDRYLALLAAVLRRPATAVRHFERALSLHEGLDMAPDLARTACDYATYLVGTGESRVRARAARLTDLAVDLAGRLGMQRVAERACRLRSGRRAPALTSS